MELESQSINGTLVVHLIGRLDAANVPETSRQFSTFAEDESPRLVIDLEEVDFIDSSGLGLVVSFHRKGQERGVEVAFSAPSPQVRTLLELTRLDRVLKVYATLDEAVAAGA